MKILRVMKKKENFLLFAVLLAVILSIIISVILRQYHLTAMSVYFITIPGTLFMNMLKMLILPLMILSILSGVTSLNLGMSKKLGILALSYYVLTTLMAAILGIILVTVIHPGGAAIKQGGGKLSTRQMSLSEAVVELLNNIFTTNIIRATMQQVEIHFPLSNKTDSFNVVEKYNNVPNFFGVIFFTIFFGLVLAIIGKPAKPLIDLIQILNNAIIRMTLAVMNCLPVGVFFLIMKNLLSIHDLLTIAIAMGWYIVTVVLGLFIHSFIVLAAFYFIVTRKNPFVFVWNMSRAMVTGFLIQSSSATLPVTIQCVEENNNINPIVSRFMLPIGAVCNMDGTGLYEAIAAIFIAQINQVSLGFGSLITISLTATLAAIGAATVPSAGLVTLLIVLSSVNLPTDDISLLYSMDWFLDRCRTSVNILGDAYGCGIVQHLCSKQLRQMTERDEEAMNIEEREKLYEEDLVTRL